MDCFNSSSIAKKVFPTPGGPRSKDYTFSQPTPTPLIAAIAFTQRLLLARSNLSNVLYSESGPFKPICPVAFLPVLIVHS